MVGPTVTKPELDEAKRLAELPMSELVMHNMEDVRRLFIDVVTDLQKENERLRDGVQEAGSIFLKLKHGSPTVEDCGLIAIEHGNDWIEKYSDLMREK